MGDDVSPFGIDIPDADVADLRDRLRRARWPEPETVDDWSQGTPLAFARTLCRYWLEDYDWPVAEARLNRWPQFLTTIDGLDIHFIHVRSPHEGAVPLLITHGWPGSVIEFHKVIGPFTDPVAFGGNASDAFHVVCPSLPGFGFSGKPRRTGWGVERIAGAWGELMGRLGYARFGAQGGDWGSWVTMALARQRPEDLIGIHLNMVPMVPDPATVDERDLSEPERAALASLAEHRAQGSGYLIEQSTRPQSVGYGLVDSPAGLCAWIVEKFFAWSDCEGDPANVFSFDELLDNIMLYWLAATGASSARLYWESALRVLAGGSADPIRVPAACSIFPKEFHRPSRRWAEPHFSDLRYWHEPDRGGHFAALEQPAIFVDEVRAAFRQLR